MPSEITTMKACLDAFNAAVDSIGKLGTYIKNLVATGRQAWDGHRAAKERDRLVDLSRRLSILRISYQEPVLMQMDEFIEQPEPDERGWMDIQSRLGTALWEVKRLLEDIKKENSDFVLEPAYPYLLRTLELRSGTIAMLSELSMPTTDEEIEALKNINDSYKKLVSQLSYAARELTKYIKARS